MYADSKRISARERQEDIEGGRKRESDIERETYRRETERDTDRQRQVR